MDAYYDGIGSRNDDKVVYGDSQSHLQQFLLGDVLEDEDSQQGFNDFYAIENFVNVSEYRANQSKGSSSKQIPKFSELFVEEARQTDLPPPPLNENPLPQSPAINISSQRFSQREILINTPIHQGYELNVSWKSGGSAKKAVMPQQTAVAPAPAIPTTHTATTSSTKSTINLLDRPSHWGSSAMKSSKPPVNSKKTSKAMTKEMMKPRTAAPRPLQTSSLTSNNPSRLDLSFRPAWLSQSTQSSTRESSRSTPQPREQVEEMDERDVTGRDLTRTHSSIAPTTVAELPHHHKSKSRSSTAKPGSLRWLLAKVIRENESLNTWITNNPPTTSNNNANSSSSLSLHDPRNRVDLSIEVEVFRNHGFYNPFLVFTALMVVYQARTQSSSTKRKAQTDSYQESFQEMEEEVQVKPAPSLPAVCVIFNSHPQAMEKQTLAPVPNVRWKLFNPICTPLHQTQQESLPPVVQKVISEFQQPIDYLILTHCPMESLFAT